MIGVVIGDSIAEGYPALWGRLEPDGEATFNPTYPNQSGQISCELSRFFGFHFYNHGIISQQTTDIWARWRRDVLAETYDPGDGRGDKTLNEIPSIVYIHVGCNDFAHNDDPDLDVIKTNFTNMLTSLRLNDIKAVLSNIPNRGYTTAQRDKVLTFNSWLSYEAATYGAKLFDEYTWSLDANNPLKSRFDCYVDNVHLNKDGYKMLAQLIYETYSN